MSHWTGNPEEQRREPLNLLVAALGPCPDVPPPAHAPAADGVRLVGASTALSRPDTDPTEVSE
jgi:hypothetical protein